MNRFETRLTRDLDEIIDRAIASPSALADFRARAAEATEQPEQEVVIMLTPTDTRPARRRWVVPALAGVAAAAVIAVIGIAALRDNGGDPDQLATSATAIDDTVLDDSAPAGDARAYVAGGGELSERQLQMLDMVDDYAAALRANDVDTVMGLYHAQGSMHFPYDWFPEYQASDGTLAEHLRNDPELFSDFDPIEPMLVDASQVVFFEHLFGVNVIEFSSSGPLKITFHTTAPIGTYSIGGSG